VHKANIMLQEALNWRLERPAHRWFALDGTDENENHAALFRNQSTTGKNYVPGTDAHGRAILVLNSSRENSSNDQDAIDYLGWNMELAMRTMALQGKKCDKIVVFIHMTDFSVWNQPSMAMTKETLNIFSTVHPESLGIAVVLDPPYYFLTFWRTVSGLIDPKTRSKMLMVFGDNTDGSANDLMLTDIIGPNWKDKTGVEKPVISRGYSEKHKTDIDCSPGFDPTEYWKSVQSRELLSKQQYLESNPWCSSDNFKDQDAKDSKQESGAGKSVNRSVSCHLKRATLIGDIASLIYYGASVMMMAVWLVIMAAALILLSTGDMLPLTPSWTSKRKRHVSLNCTFLTESLVLTFMSPPKLFRITPGGGDDGVDDSRGSSGGCGIAADDHSTPQKSNQGPSSIAQLSAFNTGVPNRPVEKAEPSRADLKQIMLDHFTAEDTGAPYEAAGKSTVAARCWALNKAVLRRYLRAGKGDSAATAPFLISSYDWRAKYAVDSLLEDNDALALEKEQRSLLKYHLTRCEASCGAAPLLVERIGAWNVPALVAAVADKVKVASSQFQEPRQYFSPLVLGHLVVNEQIQGIAAEAIQSMGTPLENDACDPPRAVIVFDLEGLSWALLYARSIHALFGELSALDTNHYPDSTGFIVFVNAPQMFNSLANVALRFVHADTRAKINIFPAENKTENDCRGFPDIGVAATAKLRELCGAAALPAELGGELPPGSPPYCF